MPALFYLQPLLLLASILGWIGFSRFAKRKGYSALIAHGCGFVVGCVFFFVLGFLCLMFYPAPDQDELPDKLSGIKPGMYFDLRAKGKYLCSTKEKLADMVAYLENRNQANAKRLVTADEGSDFCWGPPIANVFKYEVDGISEVTGIGKVVVFHIANIHIAENLKVQHFHMYTPMSFVEPWNNLALTGLNSNFKAEDLKADMRFTINNKEFIACRSQEDLAKVGGYRANGENDNIDRLLKNAACFSNDQIFPDDELVVKSVGKVDGVEDDVVNFHLSSEALGADYYTSIKFVNPSPAPTPSAAN